MKVELDYKKRTVTVWHDHKFKSHITAYMCGMGGLFVILLSPIVNYIANHLRTSTPR